MSLGYQYTFNPTAALAALTGASAAVSGTATPSIREPEVVAGGKTIIITLTNDTWVAAGATFDAQRLNIIQGLDSAQAEATGWNAEVRDKEVAGAVVRTSDTVVTVTLSAAAAYNITAKETVTVTAPATALTGAAALIAQPTFSAFEEPGVSQLFRQPDTLRRQRTTRRDLAARESRVYRLSELLINDPPVFLQPDTLRRPRKTRRKVAAYATAFGGARSVPPPFIFTFEPSEPGPAIAYVSNPSWVTPAGLAGGLRVLHWRTSRQTNHAGTFEMAVAVDDQLVSGAPLHLQIRRGWHLSLVQEGNHPEGDPVKDYLMYAGVVQEREYVIGEAGATLLLKGMFRTAHLADRQTWSGLAVTAYGPGFEKLVAGDTIIGPSGGVVYPAAYGTLPAQTTFDGLSRYAALVKLAELGRLILRESWDHDRPELVRIDNAPYSGCVFTNQEAFDPDQADQGQHGQGIIAGTPTIKYQGIKVLNRIVAIGSDFDGGDLTLQHATATTPYAVVTGTAPDGSTIYYVEDTVSQSTYGVVEAVLHRTDVKNPSNDPGTRSAAANVLHAVACGELLKNKSEVVEVSLAIANGADIWALPGDTVVLQFAGWVTNDAGDQVIWLDVNKLFIVTGRDDASDPSGIRQVSFTIAAPEIVIEVPGLPAAIPALPNQTTQPSFPTFNAPSMDFPGMDMPGTSPYTEDCCADPTTDSEDDAVVPLAEPVETTGAGTLNYSVFGIATNNAGVYGSHPAGWRGLSVGGEAETVMIRQAAVEPGIVAMHTDDFEGGLISLLDIEIFGPATEGNLVLGAVLAWGQGDVAGGVPTFDVLSGAAPTLLASIQIDAGKRLTVFSHDGTAGTFRVQFGAEQGVVHMERVGFQAGSPPTLIITREGSGSGSEAQIGNAGFTWTVAAAWAGVAVEVRRQ